MFRSVVYQRSKGDLDTVPLGTKMDVYRVGYEWMDHSLTALSTTAGSHSQVKPAGEQNTDDGQ